MKKLIRFFLNSMPRGVMQRLAPVATRVASVFYLGRGVECPVCGRRYRKFMPYGYVTVRGNALCPGCLSLERHRLMELYLRDRTDFYSTTPLLLHVAPEACFMRKFARQLGDNYITADLCSPLARVKMDVQAIPFADNHFDVIFCNHIIEHVDDDRRAMSELYRILKPGGWGIVQVPVDHTLAATDE
ncbi:MAG: class I SAM-dependent methyltransferase, partial [Rikenellaceae bacterium]|nr:class I SAM-dependent methyltransferase [Rikenellaceae bacterium]